MSSSTIPPAPRWDLDSIFEGGSGSKDYAAHRRQIKTDLAELRKLIEALSGPITADNVARWSAYVLGLQRLVENLELAASFAACLTSQDVGDAPAMQHEAECDLYVSEYRKLVTELEARSLDQSDDQWQLLLKQPGVSEIAFYLNELRTNAKQKMPLAQESLALELGVNGIDAFNRLYDKMAGDLREDFEEEGKTVSLSMGQVATKLSDTNRDIRRRAFAAMTAGWKRRADLAAITLNSIAGFRWTIYKQRGWSNPLHESLVQNRVQQATVDAMWNVIRREAAKLQPWIDAKKKLCNIDKFTWYDQFAPVGDSERLMSFDEAGRFAVEQASGFSTHMAEFMRMALDKNWIEAEDRPGKRGGGFCTGFGPRKQSRIFMTYAGTFENMLTLAHELGHAYHSYVLRDRPAFAAHYPMGLAETASIFAETLVIDAALGKSDEKQERLMLLDQKLQGAHTLFCDIHTRYLFEKSFYQERQEGMVSKDRLSELMIDAQRKAFGGLLDESGYHPLFWCSKLHFYLAHQPFYNWPYTFGYLFAGGVYDRAKKEGAAFADKYAALLADTGNMTTEAVAKKHLGVDLSKEDFWVDAVNRSLADVGEFVKLAG
ncbi:MAG: M3 family oligoendopeptidase [bacterium]